ncbi:hypothetical protein M413DRAFT_378913 [Hebeloma cylindrosporum]|uniref:EamA domain-containing protein n=1 Tax=Hebeloma cylindrosporum TaxID=76867 RepID=A0A0C3CKJ0_HEBCY|nr:hypothetical protein M413DRAFT_378913 [Hebeloma cylindrosporum h7]
MSTSRNAYIALTPEHADFAIPHAAVEAQEQQVPSTLHTPTLTSHVEDSYFQGGEHEGHPGICGIARIRALQVRVREVLARNTGLLLVAASQAFFSLVNVAVKKLNGIDPPVPTLELVAVRMAITYVCCMTYMILTNIPDPVLGPKGVRLLLVTRGFVGFFGLFGIYFSLQYLSLSDATVLTFLAPMCTAVAGSLLLGEDFTRKQALAGFVSLIGVILIARPTALFGNGQVRDISAISGPTSMDSAEKGTPRDRLIAVGVALVGVLGATGAYTTLRAIGKRAHPLHSLTFFSTLCVIISIIGMIVTKTPFIIPTRLEWLALLALIGVFGFVAQVLLTMGLQRETAGRGTMAVYTQVVFATILERIFFHAVPTLLSVAGTLLILGSAIYVVLTKEKETSANTKSIHLQHIPQEAAEEGLLDTHRREERDSDHRHLDKSERHVHFDDEFSRSRRSLDSVI